MDTEEHHIEVCRTARYRTYGKLSQKTDSIWFVLHGYAQLVQYFIRNFEPLDPEKHFVIAPEGLSRFYMKGTSGRVAASWMTKDDRENEIKDYVAYLNQLYHFYATSIKGKKINILGFSQGTATACRWCAESSFQTDNLILWSGFFPPDMKFEKVHAIPSTYILYGDDDPYLKGVDTSELFQFLDSNDWPYQKEVFEGKHKIYPEHLKRYAGKHNW